jgi:hypothetical protein
MSKKDDDLLALAKKRFEIVTDLHSDERKLQLEDAEFADEDQWPAEVRTARESAPGGSRPVLTIDKINQYLSQIVNELRQNKPSIKASPVDDGADVETAEVFQSIVRRVEVDCNAKLTYLIGGESAAKIGEGYWKLETDYVDEKSFDQEVRIVPVHNTFSVLLSEHNMPDGSDSEYGFIYEDVSDDEFKREWPKAKSGGEAEFSSGMSAKDAAKWKGEKTTRVIDYYYKDYKEETLYALADGSTMLKSLYEQLAESPEHVVPPVVDERPVQTCQVKIAKLTGAQVLEEKEWLGKYIPIIKVVGKAANVNGKKHFKGLVRLAKDSLRAYNYWFSTLTEKLALAPKAPFVGAVGQFATDEQRWRNANTENAAFLQYDPIEVNGAMAPPPQRQAPAAMESAMVQVLGNIEHNIETALGMFKASVGQASPQQSGKALQTLKVQTDQGTFHFPDNVATSIEYTGKQLFDIIPKLYDTKRIVRIMGEDGKSDAVQIDPQQEESRKETPEGTIYNLNVGKYDVTATVGASYATKRIEQSEIMMQLAQNQPELLAKIGDLLFKSMDWPLAKEIARRFEAELPPHLKPQQDGQLPPEILAIVEEVKQQQQMLEEKAQALNEAENEISQKGTQVDKAAIQVMADTEAVKIQSSQLELQKSVLELMKREMELEKDDPALIDAQVKLKLAEMEQETKYVTTLLQEDSKEKAARMADNTSRRTAGLPTDEEAEAEDKRLEETKQAVADMAKKIDGLQAIISKVSEEKPAPKIDTSGIEKTIASLGKEVKKVDKSAEILNPLNDQMKVMSEILAYLKAPKKAKKDKDGNWTVRVK